MNKILLATIMVALVFTITATNLQKMAFGQSDSDSDTVGRQILCYGAGLGMLASGVPLPAVIGAGQLAHQKGICP